MSDNKVNWVATIGKNLIKETTLSIGDVDIEKRKFCDKCNKMHVWKPYFLEQEPPCENIIDHFAKYIKEFAPEKL